MRNLESFRHKLARFVPRVRRLIEERLGELEEKILARNSIINKDAPLRALAMERIVDSLSEPLRRSFRFADHSAKFGPQSLNLGQFLFDALEQWSL